MAKQTQSEQSQKTEKPLKTLVKAMIAKDSKKAFYNFQACALNHSAISPTVYMQQLSEVSRFAN